MMAKRGVDVFTILNFASKEVPFCKPFELNQVKNHS